MQLHGAWPDARRDARARLRAARCCRPTGGRRRGALPARRAAPAARRVRRGRGGLPAGQPARPRAADRAWRCCGSRRAGPSGGRGDPAGRSTRAPTRPSRAHGCCRPTSRSCSRSATSAARATGGRRAGRRSPPRRTPRCCGRIAAQAPGRCCSPRTSRGPRSRAAPGLDGWQDLDVPYEAARVRGLDRAGLPRARRRGRGPDGARRRAAGPSQQLGASPTWPASDAALGPAAARRGRAG